ncbi:hypothetical protein QM306_38785, partial [Burkholderia cenocepacia]|nr:hypothetical protein [Burkholderia cenocepacia]
AALVAGKISLLPSTHTPEMVRQLASFAPDAFCLHDAPDCAIDLPRFAYPDAAPGEPAADAPFAVPQIDAARIMAYVFTPGTTGWPGKWPGSAGWSAAIVNASADDGVRAGSRPAGGVLGSAKFLSPVAPGEPLDLAYDAAASGAIRFTVRTGS